MKIRNVLLSCVVALATIQNSRADLVVGNLGETSANGDGWAVILNQWVAMSFSVGTLSPTWSLESVELNLSFGGSVARDLTLSLHADNAGLPGAFIVSLSGPEPTNQLSGEILNYVPTAATTLNAGDTYWVTASAVAGSYSWTYTDPYSSADTGANGWSIGDNVVLSGNQGTNWAAWPDEPALFGIRASAVPEPGTIAFAGIGALALWRLRRRSTRRMGCNRRLCALLMTLALSAPLSARAETNEAVRALVAKMSDRLASIKTLRVKGTIRMTIEMQGMKNSTEMNQSLVYDRPKRAAVTSQQMTWVCDGENVYTRSPFRKRYSKTPARSTVAATIISDPMTGVLNLLPDAKALLSDNPAEILQELADEWKVEVLPDETLGDVPCWVVLAAPTMRANPMAPQNPRIKAWVDQSSGLIRRFESLPDPAASSTNGPTGDVTSPARVLAMMKNMTITYTADELTVNGPVTDADFAFTPAPDEKLTDSPGAAIGPYGGLQKFTLSGKPAPDFRLGLLDGTEFSLAAQSGRVVVIDFWATWCGPCMRALPHMKQLSDTFAGSNVTFVGVSRDQPGSEEKIKAAIETNGITYAIGVDQEGNISGAYDVGGIPCLVLVAPDGTIQGRMVGFSPNAVEKIEEAIRKLLAGETLSSGSPMTDDELKEAEAEKAESRRISTSATWDTNLFTVIWQTNKQTGARGSSSENMPAVGIPQVAVVSFTRSEVSAFSVSDGSLIASAPFAWTNTSESGMNHAPEFYYLRKGTNGVFVGVQRIYRKEGEEGDASYTLKETQLFGLGAAGERLWSYTMGKRKYVRAVTPIPMASGRDLLLVSMGSEFNVYDTDGTLLVEQRIPYGDRLLISDRDANGSLEFCVAGVQLACYEFHPPDTAK